MERDQHEAVLALDPRPQVQWTTTTKEQMETAEAIFRGFGSLMLPAGAFAACARPLASALGTRPSEY